jgi:hypothetical protein
LPARLPRRRRRRLLAMGVLGAVALLASVRLVLRAPTSPAGPSAPPAGSESSGSGVSVLRLPTASELNAAKLFASQRAGRVSFAVVDTSGALACYRCRASYHSASVVKAMLLVSYLDGVAAGSEALPAGHKTDLESMISVSDNDAAAAIYRHVGDEGLRELAHKAQMADFRVSGSWGSARITAADQPRFFTPKVTFLQRFMGERLECRNISRNSLHRVLQRHEILDRSAGAIEEERGRAPPSGEGVDGSSPSIPGVGQVPFRWSPSLPRMKPERETPSTPLKRRQAVGRTEPRGDVCEAKSRSSIYHCPSVGSRTLSGSFYKKKQRRDRPDSLPAQNHVGEKRSGEDLSQRPALEDRRSMISSPAPRSPTIVSSASPPDSIIPPRSPRRASGNAVAEHVIDVRGLHKHGAT